MPIRNTESVVKPWTQVKYDQASMKWLGLTVPGMGFEARMLECIHLYTQVTKTPELISTGALYGGMAVLKPLLTCNE